MRFDSHECFAGLTTNVASPFDKLRASGDPAHVTVSTVSTTKISMAMSKRRGDPRILWLLASFVLAFGLWEAVGRWPLSAAFPPLRQTFRAFVRRPADGRG